MTVRIAVGAGLAAAVAAVVVAFAAGGNDSVRSALRPQVSARGRVVTRFAPATMRTLRRLHADDVHVLAVRHGRAFYRFSRAPSGKAAGATCFAIGADVVPRDLGMLQCTNDFPSRQFPLLDLSIVQVTSRGAEASPLRVEGFAVDGIASIGLLDTHGGVVATSDVVGNTFGFDSVPPAATGELDAYDHGGHVVFSSVH